MREMLNNSFQYAAFFSEPINCFNLVSTVPYKQPIKGKSTESGFIIYNSDGHIFEMDFAFCKPIYSLEYITYQPQRFIKEFPICTKQTLEALDPRGPILFLDKEGGRSVLLLHPNQQEINTVYETPTARFLFAHHQLRGVEVPQVTFDDDGVAQLEWLESRGMIEDE
jgi:hypothetical protein